MDKRKDSLSTLKICRFCLTQDVPMASLYAKRRKQKNAVNLPLKILSCVSMEVFPSDKMPSYICERCKYFMNICYDFKQICRQADETILHYIQDNNPLKPVSWPVSLSDVYRESNEIGVMKTVVEDGTTVQVTHDMSDSEDGEEENVYNVKINDGTDEVAKTCVKVVASKQEDKDKKQKGLEERCWPCDQCDSTFPLQQMLDLHMLRKHRQRTVSCDQCDDKFFSKYDLAIHQLRHSEDVPFQCVACGKKFKRLVLLKGHEKLMHADLAKHACQQCPATFLSQEDLNEHIRKHEQYSARTHTCTVCNKKFQYKTSLQNHIHAVHERVPQYACDYCPQRYTSVNKLTSHIRSHAGERPYPCKYCDKSFVKSHHYTRHIRVKHREEDRRRDSIQVEQYPCEQCDESFGNQDELIYHSAIHATQNLTCPLCQEKFPDVDAVTTHIKSHVSGVEFMCDYCELVFTAKEKLENHMLRAHEEELQQELNQDTQDESSNLTMEGEIDADNEAEDDDNSMNVKEEGDHMVVEIKKASEFMLKEPQYELEKAQENSTEESNSESEYTEPASMETATVQKTTQIKATPPEAPVKQPSPVAVKPVVLAKPVQSEQAAVIRKSEEIKRRVAQQVPGSPAEKKEKTGMAQVSKIENANDKSLRLLEKELQDLKRTNSRSEAVKTPVKALEIPKPRGRTPLHSSTPKTKPVEEKRNVLNKMPAVEKKQVEKKIVTKENKEPKEAKSINKEEKDKSIIKNGTSDKSGLEDGIRRSTRPSKIKDYAKMIRVNTQEDSDSDELGDDDDDYKEGDTSKEVQSRVKGRRNSVRPSKGSPAPAAAAALSPNAVAAPPRKRGRPRKEPTPQELPTKVKKMEPEPEEELPAKSDEKPTKVEEKLSKSENKTPKAKGNFAEAEQKTVGADQRTEKEGLIQPSHDSKVVEMETNESQNNNVAEPEKNDNEGKDGTLNKNKEFSKSPHEEANLSTSEAKIVSPSGQALKKVPIRSLPPGVKPLPLNLGRTLPSGQLCEMQIGKKVVKVQKIVMTKAEVEAMAKQGLVEMKGGTMVLKHGIKLPTVDNVKSISDDGDKESPTKTINKPVPTRCDLGNE